MARQSWPSPPMRFSISAFEPMRSVAPSGRPQMARMWFSNWLVRAPSIVQWPELWTRGAISLNTGPARSEEHTSELQSLMRISYAVFRLNTQQTQLEDAND